jgi:hypothetical protein
MENEEFLRQVRLRARKCRTTEMAIRLRESCPSHSKAWWIYNERIRTLELKRVKGLLGLCNDSPYRVLKLYDKESRNKRLCRVASRFLESKVRRIVRQKLQTVIVRYKTLIDAKKVATILDQYEDLLSKSERQRAYSIIVTLVETAVATLTTKYSGDPEKLLRALRNLYKRCKGFSFETRWILERHYAMNRAQKWHSDMERLISGCSDLETLDGLDLSIKAVPNQDFAEEPSDPRYLKNVWGMTSSRILDMQEKRRSQLETTFVIQRLSEIRTLEKADALFSSITTTRAIRMVDDFLQKLTRSEVERCLRMNVPTKTIIRLLPRVKDQETRDSLLKRWEDLHLKEEPLPTKTWLGCYVRPRLPPNRSPSPYIELY